MQDSRVDDCWNIDGSRDVSDYWSGFTQYTLLEEEPPNGYMWARGMGSKRQVRNKRRRIREGLATAFAEPVAPAIPRNHHREGEGSSCLLGRCAFIWSRSAGNVFPDELEREVVQ